MYKFCLLMFVVPMLWTACDMTLSSAVEGVWVSHATELSILYEETYNLKKDGTYAYDRKQEVDPADYRQFLHGIETLTPTERKIFDYYLTGKNVKDILALAAIKESTLRFHNKNIYSKLGVNSLKQLLRYAALMQQDEAHSHT